MEAVPVQVKSIEKHNIIQIAATKGISAALSDDGVLFVWGSKLGHEPSEVPKHLFDGMKIEKIACGGEAGMLSKAVIAAITEDGSLWTFGDTESSMLGVQLSTSSAVMNQSQSTPTKIDIKTNRNASVKKVVDVFCGPGFHMGIIAEV